MVGRKPIWAEGIFLSQQHFQQWDRYLETQQWVHQQAIAPFTWGLRSLSIETDALLNGEFRVQQCQAIFAHGQLVCFNEQEGGQLNSPLEAAPGEAVDIYLCLPRSPQVAGITGYASHPESQAMWQAEYHEVSDLYDVDRKRELLYGRLNVKILAGEQPSELFYTLKIARAVHQGEQRYSLDQQFIPTVMQIQAAPVLMQLLQRIVAEVTAKTRLLYERRPARVNPLQGLELNGVEHCLLLQSLTAWLPALQHLQTHAEIHPHQLYQVLIQLLGQLAAFADYATLTQIPNYEHHQLSNTFIPLTEHLLATLSAITPSYQPTLLLQRESDTLYTVDKLEDNLLSQCQFFLAVSMPGEALEWVARFVRQIKLGSRSHIDAIVTAALPGLGIKHLSKPPAQLAVKLGYEYFLIEAMGKCWQQILKDKSISLFLPAHFSEVSVDLLALSG